MGTCCNQNNLGETEILTKLDRVVEIDENRKRIYFNIENDSEVESTTFEVELLAIHVGNTPSTMSFSKEIIDNGNKLPFLLNADIQTENKGEKNRIEGNVKGNVYTTSCFPFNMIKNEFKDKDIFIKLVSISIYDLLDKYACGEFLLKYPNEIICKDGKKIGEILIEMYNDFINVEVRLNIVHPEQNEVKGDGKQQCCFNNHYNNKNDLNALEMSIEITKKIFYNLSLSILRVTELYDQLSK